jgi:minor extracellular serine protease Vpr
MRNKRAFAAMAAVLAATLPLLISIASAESRIREYALVLKTPPIAAAVDSRKSLRTAAAEDRAAMIAAEQSGILSELQRLNIPVRSSAQFLVNAIFVAAPSEQAPILRRIPGVARVQYMPPMRRHLFAALDLVRAAQAWTANGIGGVDRAGSGVKIAILDTGLDLTHPALQDSTLQVPTGYPKGIQKYTNSKVIVARSYVAQLPFGEVRPEDSRPDDATPRDRSGHGTAMAMAAAGARTAGPLGTITGVAPKAWLGNYKIFGSTGVNDTTTADVLVQALQDALDDDMDVTVLALGSPALYGPLDTDPTNCGGACDVRAQAVENAVRMGLTVVASAGDSGDLGLQFPALGSISTPGTTPAAITVGASTNSHVFFSSVRVPGSDAPAELQRVRALFGEGPRPASALTAPLRDVATLSTDALGCTALPARSLAGAIALVQRGTCDFGVKIHNAEAAGAIGVVIFQIDGSDFLFRITSPAVRRTGIPAVMIGNTAGAALRNLLRTSPDRRVTLDPVLVQESATANQVATFSSHGPAIGTGGIKPEVVAPGTDLYTATQRIEAAGDVYDRTGFTSVSGTSFASALVAGASALVKQVHPAFTPAQVKSAVVNTASQDVSVDNGVVRVNAVGVGKLDAAAAVNSIATVEPATLSFGIISQQLPPAINLRVTNTGNVATNFQVTVVPRLLDPNAQVTVSSGALNLNAGQSGTVSVKVQGSVPQAGAYDGIVQIQGGGATLRVPYLFVVGDGLAFDAQNIGENDFIAKPGATGLLLAFRVTDRYGAPVQNAAVKWFVEQGGGKIDSADSATAADGIAAASVTLGTGEQSFSADVAGLADPILFFGQTRAAPVIQSVVNAASFDGGAQAPGSYISIFGTDLSDTTLAYSGNALAISLAGVSVSFDSPAAGGQAALSLPGRLHFVSPKQINVQIPWELQGRSSALMKVSVGDIQSATFNLSIAGGSPAAFSNGTIAAVVDAAGQVVTASNPARRGQVVSIYANGLGAVQPTPETGEPSPSVEPLSRTTTAPTVSIGSRPAPVSFSGLAPFFVGLYQVNVMVPADAGTGNQPLVISTGGVVSKTATIPVQ